LNVPDGKTEAYEVTAMPKRTLVYKGRTIVIETEGDSVVFQIDGRPMPVTSDLIRHCGAGLYSPFVSDSSLMDMALCLADYFEQSGTNG